MTEKEKNGWTNDQWDSSIFMGVFLAIFAGFIYFCVNEPEFRNSDIAKNLMMLFSSGIGGMATYFFGKMKQTRNGDTKPS